MFCVTLQKWRLKNKHTYIHSNSKYKSEKKGMAIYFVIILQRIPCIKTMSRSKINLAIDQFLINITDRNHEICIQCIKTMSRSKINLAIYQFLINITDSNHDICEPPSTTPSKRIH